MQDAVAVATEPDTREVVEADRPDLADRPAAEEPKADAALSGVKEPTVKKARRKTAHHRRREHNRSWAYSDPWRAQGIRYAGYGGQRGWYGDR